MTAFAIDFRRRRIVVATDTAVFAPARGEARALGHLSKVHALPCLRAVLLSRGMITIAAHAALVLGLNPQIGTIEDAAAALPPLLRSLTDEYCRATDIDDPAAYGLAEVVLCGWSEAEGRMRLWHHLNTELYRPRADDGAEYRFLTMPRLPDRLLPRGRSLDERLVDALLMQQREFAADGVRIGGEVHRWTITPAGISQSVTHRFADYAATAAGAELFDRIAAGQERVDVAAGLTRAAELRVPA